MRIREMSSEECLRLLNGVRLVRLACASGNQPYVVPVYLAYHQPVEGKPRLYGFTTIGQKVDWMRANPLVCVEFDELTSDTQWLSVIIFGRYEELPAVRRRDAVRLPEHQANEPGTMMPHGPERTSETLFAHHLLEARAMWWEPASTERAASAHGDLAKALVPIYYKVWIDQVTGYESTRDANDGDFSMRVGRSGRHGWLRRVLHGVPNIKTQKEQ